MRARPGRLLPSVVVGGLLISGLALGAGVANAADPTCKASDGTDVPMLGILLKADTTGACELTVAGKTAYKTVDAATAAILAGAKEVAPATTTTTAPPAGDGAGGTTEQTPADGTKATVAPTTSSAPAKPVAQQQGNGMVVPPPAALPPAPAALGAAGPVGALPPLAGIAPAGLASNLFSANTYDPGLLFGSPLGNAASALFSPKADSAVTTVSQAQALAAPTGSGYGTPATIGVIILACLIGIAVRHRVISRMKSRELPAAEYQPRHAAPESQDTEQVTEQVTGPDAEPETELHDASEARTLVVLSRR